MKKSLIGSIAVVLALSATSALAQQKMIDGMKGIPMDKPTAGRTVHAAKGTVTKVDGTTGVVTLAHDPIKSLNWPAMTMSFKVKDKMLLDKLGVGKIVDFEFAQADTDYVITGVK